jgi:hypothetical protein
MKSSPRRAPVVHAMADAMFEGCGGPCLDALVEDVMLFVASATFASRVTLRAALLLLRVAPLLLFASWRTLDRMSRPDRLAMLARLEQTSITPLLLAFVAWRTLVVLHFYEDAAELARVGYTDARKRHLLPLLVPVPAESGVRLRGIEEEELEELEEKKGAA